MSPTITATEIRPQFGPQERFLSTSADIAIYGGAAGGGKTWALLLEALRHAHNPDFGAVIFRRTFPQITQQGGMWDESKKLYPLLNARALENDLMWRFASGSKVKFAHLQRDANVYDWQGAQIPFIGFDELTHFTQRQFFYLLSRNRSTCGVRPYVRATTNPDADSWVAEFIAWWIDQETGYAIPERSGVVRWFVRENEIIEWADTPDELYERFPDNVPKSATFIAASLYDNRILMAGDPGYKANLMAQPLVERERLLGGNWKIRPASGKIFNRAWFEIVEAVPAGGVDCRFWDMAATEKKMDADDPDFTAAVLMRRHDGIYYVLDCIAVQSGPTEVDRMMLNLAQQDRAYAQSCGASYRVRWETEPGSSGVRETVRLIKMLAGFDCAGIRPESDKITRAKGLAAQSEPGNVKLLHGAWNQEWLVHMHNQPEWTHDDIMDASSGAFNDLATALPTVSPPPMTSPSKWRGVGDGDPGTDESVSRTGPQPTYSPIVRDSHGQAPMPRLARPSKWRV